MSDSSPPPGARAKWGLLPQALPGLVIAAALSVLFGHEAWSAIQSPEPYGFGTEAMIARGGREYASLAIYAVTSGLSAALSLLSIGVLLRGAFLGNPRFMSVGYLCLLGAPMIGKIL
jgi:hypothetical protein